ncbi:MAG: Flp pilus assembly protein CpaB [Anaerolineaceae bacterium]|nr:Flp pilus assembly protein CpaB [Anaerolineaceae bacterium]
MSNIRKLIPYIGAGFVILIVFVLSQPEPKTDVVTAAYNLPEGHVLEMQDLMVVAMDTTLLPATYLSDPELLLGQTVKTARTQGDLVMLEHVGENVVELRPNERAVTLRVQDDTGMGGLLKPGDYVGVVAAVFSQGSNIGDGGTFTKMTVEGLRVLYLSPQFEAEMEEISFSEATPDPMIYSMQEERREEGVIVVAVPVETLPVLYDFSKTDPSIPNEMRMVNAIEMLTALNASPEAKLSLYMIPENAQEFNTSGFFLPDLVITAGPTPTMTPTMEPTATPYGYTAPTEAPPVEPTATPGS